jgi:2-oxoglutarate ferredoxin oxidoreductase subunit alpha
MITETPVVICVVQRLGPCTGGATQGAQGDILITEFASSGGYTIPVLYPTNSKECYELTVEAFNWAEKYRTPVVLLTDKEVGMTTESLDYNKLNPPPNANRHVITEHDTDFANWKMYGFDSPDMIAKFAPVGGKVKVTATGSAHNANGYLRKNDPETLATLKHLEDKIRSHRDEMVLVKDDYDKDADTLVISFGITARTMKDAVNEARLRGRKVSSLTVYSMFPIPDIAILKAANGCKNVIVAEENINGQYRILLEPLLKDYKVTGINKLGSMITPDEILERILKL